MPSWNDDLNCFDYKPSHRLILNYREYCNATGKWFSITHSAFGGYIYNMWKFGKVGPLPKNY